MAIALPHTDPQHVIRPFISVTRLSQPLAWQEMGNDDNTLYVQFIVLLGFDRKPESLELNGVSLSEGASLNALNYGSGWYWREDTAVIVSVPKLEKTEIHVIHKEQ